MDKKQIERWEEIDKTLIESISTISDQGKIRKIKNLRSRLAWALDQYESGLDTVPGIINTLSPDVAEKFKEIVGYDSSLG